MLPFHPLDALALADERARSARPADSRRAWLATAADRRIDGADGVSVRPVERPPVPRSATSAGLAVRHTSGRAT
jgi:hypothetical protein